MEIQRPVKESPDMETDVELHRDQTGNSWQARMHAYEKQLAEQDTRIRNGQMPEGERRAGR